MSEKPANLAAALAAVQAKLPEVGKGNTAEVEGMTKSGKPFKYKYQYADLADVSKAILPLLGQVGLSWITRPTLNDQGNFVLAYELLHTSGDSKSGEYPLKLGTPQEMGSAITYARRYALCSVTGVAPESDDDDGAHASRRPAAEEWEAAQPASREQADAFVAWQKCVAEAQTGDDLKNLGPQIKASERDGDISHWQFERLVKQATIRMAAMREAAEPELAETPGEQP